MFHGKLKRGSIQLSIDEAQHIEKEFKDEYVDYVLEENEKVDEEIDRVEENARELIDEIE